VTALALDSLPVLVTLLALRLGWVIVARAHLRHLAREAGADAWLDEHRLWQHWSDVPGWYFREDTAEWEPTETELTALHAARCAAGGSDGVARAGLPAFVPTDAGSSPGVVGG
jgi:hypothetical protein